MCSAASDGEWLLNTNFARFIRAFPFNFLVCDWNAIERALHCLYILYQVCRQLHTLNKWMKSLEFVRNIRNLHRRCHRVYTDTHAFLSKISIS